MLTFTSGFRFFGTFLSKSANLGIISSRFPLVGEKGKTKKEEGFILSLSLLCKFCFPRHKLDEVKNTFGGKKAR